MSPWICEFWLWLAWLAALPEPLASALPELELPELAESLLWRPPWRSSFAPWPLPRSCPFAQPLPGLFGFLSSPPAPVAAEPPVPPELPLIELLSDERAVCELVLEPCCVAFWFCSPDCTVLELWLSVPICGLACTLGDAVTSPVLGLTVTLCANAIWLKDAANRLAHA